MKKELALLTLLGLMKPLRQMLLISQLNAPTEEFVIEQEENANAWMDSQEKRVKGVSICIL